MKNVKFKCLRLKRESTGSYLIVELKKFLESKKEAEELVKKVFPGWRIIGAR